MGKLADMVAAYLEGPGLVRRAVAGLTDEQLRARPVPGQWSTQEVVAHLADFEPVYAERFLRAIAFDRPLVLAADDKAFSSRLAYAARDVALELDFIDITRRRTAALLLAQPDSVLARECVHSEAGVRTVEQLLESVTNHVPHHLRFVAEKRRALGA